MTFFFVLQIKDFFKRFKRIPDILELDHLTVSGDVTFGKGVSLRVRGAMRNFLVYVMREYVASNNKSARYQRALNYKYSNCLADETK